MDSSFNGDLPRGNDSNAAFMPPSLLNQAKGSKSFQINEQSNSIYRIHDYDKIMSNQGHPDFINTRHDNMNSIRGDFEKWLTIRKEKNENIINANLENSVKNEQITRLVNKISEARNAIAADLDYQREKEEEFEKLKLKKEEERRRPENQLSNSMSSLTASFSNLFPATAENESDEKDKFKVIEAFEKYLGKEGLRVSVYVPVIEDEDDDSVDSPQRGYPSSNGKTISRAKFMVIKYEKSSYSIVIENKIHGQYQRLKLSVITDIDSINKGFSAEIVNANSSMATTASSFTIDDRNSRFIHFVLTENRPEINIEFTSSDRRDMAFVQFQRFLTYKKSVFLSFTTPHSSSTAPLQSSTGLSPDEELQALPGRQMTHNSESSSVDKDKVSSFIKFAAKSTTFDENFYKNPIKAKDCLHISAEWFNWLLFIVRDAYGSSNQKDTGTFGNSSNPGANRLVVISTGGIVSCFRLHDDGIDEGIFSILNKFKKGMWDKQVLLGYGYQMERTFKLTSISKMTPGSKGPHQCSLELLFKERNEPLVNFAFKDSNAREEVRKKFEEIAKQASANGSKKA